MQNANLRKDKKPIYAIPAKEIKSGFLHFFVLNIYTNL